jgi:hypothetical protein
VRDELEEEWSGAATERRYALVVQVDEVVSVVVFAGTLGEVRRKRAELLAAGHRAAVEEEAGGW